jgi:hypothetical protein
VTDLPPRLRAAAAGLNRAAVAEEYEDPFWRDRYGERGRRFAEEDGLHHFGYVAEAVESGSTTLLTRYARWLRGVLVARGMCSEHLADGLRIRARRLAALAWPDAEPALAAFAAADVALRHPDGPAAALLPAPELPDLAAPVAAAHHLDPDAVVFDLRHLRSYLADALALARPDLLRAHLDWRAGFDARRGRPPRYLPDLLAALLGPDAPAAARTLLAAARSA